MPDCDAPPTPEDLITLDRAAVVARLLAGILHDVNNSLLVISGTAEILGAEPASALDEGLERIRDRATAAAVAIDHVLSFARGDVAARGPVDLRAMAARALDLRAFSMRRAGIAAVLSPPEGVTDFVEGNAVLIQQAILGLVTNAEQALAARPGGRIDVSVGRDGDSVHLRVTDNGPGVAERNHARIFEPFFTTRSRQVSSGLGLAAARAIAGVHGGTVALAPTASGAAFVLTFPRFGARA